MNIVTEKYLQSLSSSESFARGYELYLSDAVFETMKQCDLLIGKCMGTSAPFYQLRIRLGKVGIQDASCTCSYDLGGYCKHVIALILTYIHNPQIFIEQKRIDEMLNDMDRDALLHLIEEMVEKDPSLLSRLQSSVQIVSVKSNFTHMHNDQRTQILQNAYIKQIQGILHSLDGYRLSQAYWMMGDMVAQLEQIVDIAYEFLVAGDTQGALVILTTLLTEVGESFEQFDDSAGRLGDFLNGLALPIAETVLSIEFSKNQRRKLINELNPVIQTLLDYGMDDLKVILAALNRGWSDDFLDEAEDYVINEMFLVEAKLNVLERQNRVEEFLKLCLETGEYQRFVLKQVEEKRFEEAIEVAWKTLSQASDALMIAKALYKVGYLSDALGLAEKGLTLGGCKHELGKWLGPIEEAQGRDEQAIQAYQAAFISFPSLNLYNVLKKLSGPDWEKLRFILMQVFQTSSHSNVLIDIYLSEKEWDAAIDTVENIVSWQYDLIEKVADAVLPYRPDWVIQASRKQAEELIAKTQSKYYVIAASWLLKMKKAYCLSGRKNEWLIYLDDLKSTYSRRPALQAALCRL